MRRSKAPEDTKGWEDETKNLRPERPILVMITPTTIKQVYKMGQSLSNILTHVIFSTKNREPFLHDLIQLRLYGYIRMMCKDRESPLIQIGGIADHIHLLVNLSRKYSMSQFVNEIKSNSSKWIKTIDNDLQNFAWQSGYGAFSVGQLEYEKVIKYIAEQKEHHKTISFQEEYLRFLKTYGMNYDEKYLWE